MLRRRYKSRLYFIFIIFISILVFYIGRVFDLQLFRSSHLSQLADNQHNIILEIKPERGDIYDRNMNRLAVDCSVYSIYAVPKEIDEKARFNTAKTLSQILNIDANAVQNKLNNDGSFAWIKREVTKEESDSINKLNLKGIKLKKEDKRFYPNGPLASHIIGFAGIDDVGLEGIELIYDKYLRGTPGWRWTIRDAKRRDILSRDVRYIPSSDGLDVMLTIDETIQHIVERELDALCVKYKTKGAAAIVMDPQNGEILAIANRPSFDLNRYSQFSAEVRRNKAVTDMYEPGSVFKVIAASGALEKGLVKIDQEFFCEDGEYYTGGRILHDHKPHGTLTFREIIEKSSNIGMAKIAELLGKDELYRFVKLYGFGVPTGIDASGEAKGILASPEEWSTTSISSISMGQEIACTSIQLISAISTIANGGRLIKPRLAREIRNRKGDVIKAFLPVETRRVIKEETAAVMRDILKGVIENGTGKQALLQKYTACGKTGTAQKIEKDGKYSHSKFIASFVGFAPARNPRIAVLVTVDEPQPVYYGGIVAAPVFKNITKDVLRYLKVQPDKIAVKVDL